MRPTRTRNDRQPEFRSTWPIDQHYPRDEPPVDELDARKNLAGRAGSSRCRSRRPRSRAGRHESSSSPRPSSSPSPKPSSKPSCQLEAVRRRRARIPRRLGNRAARRPRPGPARAAARLDDRAPPRAAREAPPLRSRPSRRRAVCRRPVDFEPRRAEEAAQAMAAFFGAEPARRSGPSRARRADHGLRRSRADPARCRAPNSSARSPLADEDDERRRGSRFLAAAAPRGRRGCLVPRPTTSAADEATRPTRTRPRARGLQLAARHEQSVRRAEERVRPHRGTRRGRPSSPSPRSCSRPGRTRRSPSRRAAACSTRRARRARSAAPAPQAPGRCRRRAARRARHAAADERSRLTLRPSVKLRYRARNAQFCGAIRRNLAKTVSCRHGKTSRHFQGTQCRVIRALLPG